MLEKIIKINTSIYLFVISVVLFSVIRYYMPVFSDSNFFFAIVTFFVGNYALFVYFNGKKDEKINAATIVLLEIRNAESKIDIIVDRIEKGIVSDLPRVLPMNSWRIYSHLFVKELDLDEIQLLSEFYSSAEILEELSIRQNNSIWITTEQRARTVQNLLATIHDDLQKDSVSQDPDALNRFNSRKKALDDYYANDPTSYAPEKIIKGLKFQTQKIKRITTTTCGTKLKKIANLNN